MRAIVDRIGCKLNVLNEDGSTEGTSPAVKTNWNRDRARHWKLFGPPARPSVGEVAVYGARIEAAGQNRGKSWGLLGCTPELRSLAGRNDCRLTCIDTNDEVFNALRSMVDPVGDEAFVHSNWLDATLPSAVDVLLADGSLNMIPPDQHAALIERASEMVRAGGTFLIRVHVATPPAFESPAAVFESYRSRNTSESAWTATRTHLDMLWLDPARRLIDFEQYHRWIAGLHAQGVTTDAEFDSYDRLLAYNRIKLYYTSSSEFEDLGSGRFDIVAVHVADDYTAAGNHPIYELRRRA